MSFIGMPITFRLIPNCLLTPFMTVQPPHDDPPPSTPKREDDQLNLFGESVEERLSFLSDEDRLRILRKLERAEKEEGPDTSAWLKRSSRHPHE